MSQDGVFHRTELAQQLATMILSKSPIAPAKSGLFLAAPRRTGKSTFVREDLRPALASLGAVVLYVDLWADKKRDPAEVIVQAVREELAKHDGVVAKLARNSGMDKVSLGGMSFSLANVGLGQGVSIAQALAALSDEVKKPIAFLIDEAQHAITTQGGSDALFALKAARDELNSSSHHGLRLVATGSDRAKLAMLKQSKEQAFYQAPLQDFPLLERDYVEWFCKHAELPVALDVDATYALFQEASNRPEVLGTAYAQVAYDLDLPPTEIQERFAQAVHREVKDAREQFLKLVRNLPPPHAAVLIVMAHQEEKYFPYDKATQPAYSKVLQALTGKEATLDTNQITAALEALKDKQLVWKATRGVYQLEEASIPADLRDAGLFAALEPAGETLPEAAQAAPPREQG
jgi:hypothetical protein